VKTAAREAFLRIPPFPGGRFTDIATSTVPSTIGNSPIDELIDDLRTRRVGGTYWGAQPEVAPRCTLVRTRSWRAVEESEVSNSGSPLVVWLDGKSPGTLPAHIARIAGDCDPWHLVVNASRVIVDSDDELALVAAIAGVPLQCLGEGRFKPLESGGREALRLAIVSEVLERGYNSPFSGEAITPDEAVGLCFHWRKLVDSNRDISAALGFAHWKRSAAGVLLWGGREVRFRSRPSPVDRQQLYAVWRSKVRPAVLSQLEATRVRVMEVEDGFIRSSGLGADCVPPLSLVVDRQGIYFDPARPSDLESLLQDGIFSPEILARSRALVALILEKGVSKYAVGRTADQGRRNNRLHILIPGQVEDDRAVLSGLGPATNLELLRRVRAEKPDAYIIYKPHPDVEAGHREGRIRDDLCLQFADEIARDQPIAPLIAMADEVHVNTSLAGFEALLRGKSVYAYGVPFYAGWGLTTDRGPVPERRSTRRSLDELAAAALLVYPRYLDPVTCLPCPPEVLISRLSRPAPPAGLLVHLRRLQGIVRRRLSSLLE